MFIGIFSKLNGDKNECYVDYYDASRIIKVTNNVTTGEGRVFWFDTGAGVDVHETPTYDAGGLIELVMRARMHPAEFMPSRNVGKAAKPEPHSTGSHSFSAADMKAEK